MTAFQTFLAHGQLLSQRPSILTISSPAIPSLCNSYSSCLTGVILGECVLFHRRFRYTMHRLCSLLAMPPPSPSPIFLRPRAPSHQSRYLPCSFLSTNFSVSSANSTNQPGLHTELLSYLSAGPGDTPHQTLGSVQTTRDC
jgi:hypothetical protein